MNMNTLDLEALLSLAVGAAEAPAPHIVQWFEADRLSVERKGDGSPVTIADREAEHTIRQILSEHPLASSFDILGEEYGQKEQGARYRWLVDPIDGTRSFINHIPLFGTIVALEDTVEPNNGLRRIGYRLNAKAMDLRLPLPIVRRNTLFDRSYPSIRSLPHLTFLGRNTGKKNRAPDTGGWSIPLMARDRLSIIFHCLAPSWHWKIPWSEPR